MGDELPEYLGNLRVVVKLTEERDALTRHLAAAREEAARYRAALEYYADPSHVRPVVGGSLCKWCGSAANLGHVHDCPLTVARRALSLEDKSRG